jgi:hypothetical protein
MKQPEDALVIRGDRADTGKEVAGEAAAFVPSGPESLPHLTVPDLAPDASGISAMELARIPTLTEQIATPAVSVPAAEPHVAPERPAEVEVDLVQVQAPRPELEVPHAEKTSPDSVADLLVVAPVVDLPQALPVAAESWLQECHSRVNQLTDEIHQLNDRLDQLEHRPRA